MKLIFKVGECVVLDSDAVSCLKKIYTEGHEAIIIYFPGGSHVVMYACKVERDAAFDAIVTNLGWKE
jgi:hypothetical protein